MLNNYNFRRIVRKILHQEIGARFETATVHSLDGTLANIRVGDSSTLIRGVPIIGDQNAVRIGSTVQIAWKGERPLILAGSGGSPTPVNAEIAVDNQTIERSGEGLRVKNRGIGFEHLTFVPALEGHTHQTLLSKGGWQVTDNGVLYSGDLYLFPNGMLTLGEPPNNIHLSAADPQYRLWAGTAQGENAPFSIDKGGNIVATAGKVGGWTLTDTAIIADSGNAELNAGTPHIQLGGRAYASGPGLWAGKDTGVYKFVLGDADSFVNWDGTSLLIQGDLRSANFLTGERGWQIANTGAAEFENVVVRGALRSTVLEYEHISAVDGGLLIAKAAARAQSAFTAPATGNSFTIHLEVPEGLDDPAGHWEIDDVVRIKSGSKEAWGVVQSITDQTTYWELGCIRAETSAVAQDFSAGTTVVNYGASGSGVIELDGHNTAIRLFTHTGSPFDVVDDFLILGDLNGYFGYSTTRMGLGIGDSDKVDDYFVATEDGIEMSGEIIARGGQFSGVISIGPDGGIYQGSGSFVSPDTGLKIWSDNGIGRLAAYYQGVEQIHIATDGKLHAGQGDVILDEDGLTVSLTESPFETPKQLKWAINGSVYDYITATYDSMYLSHGIELHSSDPSGYLGGAITLAVEDGSVQGMFNLLSNQATLDVPLVLLPGAEPTTDAHVVNKGYVDDLPSVKVSRSTDQSIPNSTDTAISFSFEKWDTDNMWQNTSPDRLTCQKAGVYAIYGEVQFKPNGTGQRIIKIRHNGADVLWKRRTSDSPGWPMPFTGYTELALNVDDIVQLVVWQDSGGSLAIAGNGAYSPILGMTYLRPLP